MSASHPAAQPPGTVQPSADAIAQGKSAKYSAWVQVFGAVLVAALGFGANYLIGLHRETPPQQPTLGAFITPDPGGTIGFGIPTISGHVSALRPGQMVWTFNESIAQKGTYYSDSGPCPVSDGVWTCHNVYVGPQPTSRNPKLGEGNYNIYAVIISDKDASAIVQDLRCDPTAKNCPSPYSELPGSAEQSITVFRKN